MSTEETLAQLTDGAKFEAIGSAYLRHAHPYLISLNDIGRNLRGKTIKSKLDGVCKYGKHDYAYPAYTTNASNLEKKWLSTHEKNLGDLPKALRKIAERRAKDSEAKFQLFLVSNQQINEELHDKVLDYPIPDYVDIRIIGNSPIASFLDHDPNGQHLRRHFLQIEATLLSIPLLHEIIQRNTENYRFKSSLNSAPISAIKSRRDLLRDTIKKTNKLILLVGESGLGKSALLYEFMSEKQQEGKLILHILPDAIRQAYSISQVIIEQLKIESRHLYVTDDQLRALIKEEIILIVDDINNVDNPRMFLDKLKTWAAMPTEIPAKIICPVWPKNLSIDANLSAHSDVFFQVKLPALSEKDALSIVDKNTRERGITLSLQQKKALVSDLGKDPLLISIYLDSFKTAREISTHETLETLSRYLEDKISSIADQRGVPAVQFHEALIQLGARMLSLHILSPSYNQIKHWFSSDPDLLTTVNYIAADKHIFQAPPGEDIVFRHDRIRDAILIESIVTMLQESSKNLVTLSDPFYAELIGAALAKSTITIEIAEEITKINPLAVFCAFKFLQDRSQESKFNLFETCITGWNTERASSSAPKELIQQIGAALVQFDTKNINKLLGSLPRTYETALAKFHNGDLEGALQYFMHGDATAPSSGNYWRDLVVDHVRHHHTVALVKRLLGILPAAFTDAGRQSFYRLAGYLQAPELIPHIRETWSLNPNTDQFPDYLWAVVQCAGKRDRSILQKALTYWATIPDESIDPRYNSRTQRSIVTAEIHLIRWTINDTQAKLLADIARKRKALQWQVSVIFRFIESPVALLFAVEYLGNILDKSQQGSFPRLFIELDRWDYSKNGRKLPAGSLEFLEAVWKSKKKSPGIREIAFTFWCGSSEGQDVIRECANIKSTDRVLDKIAIRQRVELRDQSVTSAIIRKIRKDKFIWHIEAIWNEKLKIFIDSCLRDPEFSNSRQFMEQFWETIVKIPAQDAEKLLFHHWAGLKKWPQAVGTALYLATPQSLSLALVEINCLGFDNWPRYKDHYRLIQHSTVAYTQESDPFTHEEHKNIDRLMRIFQHIDHTFGINRTERRDLLTKEKLNSLIPYLALLNDMRVKDLAGACVENGWLDWLDSHLLPFLDSSDRKQVFPNDSDLLEEIQKMALEKHPTRAHAMVRWGGRRGITNERIIAVLRIFSINAHAIKDLELICFFLAEIGTRQDLNIIDNVSVTEATDVVRAAQLKEGTQYLVRRGNLL
jgi:hypothetical protein